MAILPTVRRRNMRKTLDGRFGQAIVVTTPDVDAHFRKFRTLPWTGDL